MFTWIIDYFYLIVVAILFLISPLIILLIKRKMDKKMNRFMLLFWSFIFFSMSTTILLLLKDFHIEIIKNICFEYSTMNYKMDNIPQGCYDFKINKYMGVGWPVTAMFWIFFEFIYLGIIYVLWKLKDTIRV
jgi:hypothetical protein